MEYLEEYNGVAFLKRRRASTAKRGANHRHTAVIAADIEISSRQLDTFFHDNLPKISQFQQSARDVFFLWDENRIGHNNTPLTLDTLRKTLKEKLRALVRIEETDPLNARHIFNGFGFADTPVPKENDYAWDDSPANRVLYTLLKMIEESSYARQTFWSFLMWTDENIGLLQCFNKAKDTDYVSISPKLFGGSFTKNHRRFVFNSERRNENREQLNRFLLVFDRIVVEMDTLRSKTFRMGPKLELGVDVKFIFDDLIDILRAWRDGVKALREAYNAIPPLRADDANLEEPDQDPAGISSIPLMTLSMQGSFSPGSILAALNTQSAEENEAGEESPILISLPAYVDTDFDRLGSRPCATAERVVITTEELDYFALQETATPLEDFATTVEYFKRLFHKIYPVRPPKVDIKSDEFVQGIRIVDITLEYLDRGFKSRIARVQTLIKQTNTKNGQPDEGAGQNNFQTFGFKDGEQATRWLPRLQALYRLVHEQLYRMGGLQRWVEEDLINHNHDSWAKDLVSIAMTAMHARVDPKNPNLIEYDTFQREIWTRYLLETEGIFAGVTESIDSFLDAFVNNKLPLEKSISFEFNFDFKPHLKRLSDWFRGWQSGVRLLRKAYQAIPPYPIAFTTRFPGVDTADEIAGEDFEDFEHNLSSFNIIRDPEIEERKISDIPKTQSGPAARFPTRFKC
ncbi:hypothetical protein H072_8077 [Dactylellina haptotyla CBS 200.50]|uniref:Uncharacterized protein n=1 Tax=Dactylellina haptotyla (strain CBS 200.50) TaxID=1284197 RepID=S8A6D4_DACHA|nr:hypothetical protein H072_8077 [Dactylellina haptotyla CBS 200.50]